MLQLVAGRRRLLSTAAPSSFLLDISSDYINTKSLRNQSDLARALKSRFQSPLAFEAFEAVDRALFLSTNDPTYREPYANIPQSLGVAGGTANMSTPIHHALVLDTLHVQCALGPGSRVLDIGCGSGYLMAALYKTVGGPGGQGGSGGGGVVVGVDRVPELVALASKCLADCPVTSAAPPQSLVVADAYDSGGGGKWNLKAMQESGPYDAIHVGFAFNPETDSADVEMLCSLLKKDKPDTSRVLAGWGADLCLFDSKAFRKEVARLPGLAKMEQGTFVRPLSRAEKMDRAKRALEEWKQKFEAKHGRKPSKADLLGDAEASLLFKEFAQNSNKFGAIR